MRFFKCSVAPITLVIANEGSTIAKAAAPEPTEGFQESRSLDATGVLVGQSGSAKNMKSLKVVALLF
jgi:hypothetical protein